MPSQSSVAVAAAILADEEELAPLILCVLHSMRDERFVQLIDALIELNPSHWDEIYRSVKELEYTQ